MTSSTEILFKMKGPDTRVKYWLDCLLPMDKWTYYARLLELMFHCCHYENDKLSPAVCLAIANRSLASKFLTSCRQNFWYNTEIGQSLCIGQTTSSQLCITCLGLLSDKSSCRGSQTHHRNEYMFSWFLVCCIHSYTKNYYIILHYQITSNNFTRLH